MDKHFLKEKLTEMGPALRENRERVAKIILENPELIPYLLEIVFDVKNKLSIKAAWALEIVCEKKLDFLIPHLDNFTLNIGTLIFDSSVRPTSKICNFIAIAFNSNKNNKIKDHLTQKHIDAIIEVTFDWMISNHKVATKAYSMNVLYIFGKNNGWVHPELKLILQQKIPKESAAYKARGKITLDLINRQ